MKYINGITQDCIVNCLTTRQRDWIEHVYELGVPMRADPVGVLSHIGIFAV